MTMAAKLRRAPLRIVTGAYILNSGVTKFSATDDMAKGLHGTAAGSYPILEKIPPKTFPKVLGGAETALGAALLLPIVPAGVAGLALAGFAGALLGMYWKTPGMHEEGTPRPTVQGTAIAKDVWMLGIGTSLVVDSMVTPVSNSALRGRTQAKAVAKAEAKAARKAANQVADRTARRASKQAQHARTAAQLTAGLTKSTAGAAKSTVGVAKSTVEAAKSTVGTVRSAADTVRSAAESVLPG